MRVADYVVKVLADRGVRHVFLVAGGASMHLCDAFGREHRVKVVCCHHEQAAVIAAEAYARVTGTIGVACVTAGPGATNAITGVFGAWTDSVPVLVLSGQCRVSTLTPRDRGPRLRQLGDQEIDGAFLSNDITKYNECLTDARWARYNLEKALHLATSGRPGPCWLDVPVDVQGADCDPGRMEPYRDSASPGGVDPKTVGRVIGMLRESRRPVILVGSGVRIAGATQQLAEVATRLGVPVVTAWAVDAIRSDHPCFVGRQGTIGDRAGNWAVQNSDLLLILGSRLSIRQVSYNWKSFAPKATKVWVDIDPAELAKPTVKPDLPICCDVRVFLDELLRQENRANWPADSDWLKRCQQLRRDYPVVLPRHREWAGKINHYAFLEALWSQLADDDVVVCGNSTATIATMQVANIKGDQRLLSSSGSAAMGWCLPAAVGAAFAHKKRIVCVTGDGSVMLNLQELQTIAHHRLPVKIFVLCNNGYQSIRDSQNRHFGRCVGADAASGVSFPSFVSVAKAFGVEAVRVIGRDYADYVEDVLATDGPLLCAVECDPAQGQEPRVESRRLPDGTMETASLDSMSPRLPKGELGDAMETV